MRIYGIDQFSLVDLEEELLAGGRFVFFEYCISLIVVSLRRPSGIYFLRGNQYALPRGLPFTLISLLLGWWGLPWGVIYTPLTLLTNLSGGQDVTEEVWAHLHSL